MLVEEERIWIQKIKRGDQGPFKDLYARHHRKLFSLCYRFTGNHTDAEDQMQEIFLKVIHKIEKFAGQSAFSTWMHRLATNHLINFTQRRKEQYEAPLEHAQEQESQNRDVPLNLVLQQAIRELPEGYRNVFILHDQEGFKHDEIADILDISPATSRSQLTRARLALREKLKPMLHMSEEQQA